MSFAASRSSFCTGSEPEIWIRSLSVISIEPSSGWVTIMVLEYTTPSSVLATKAWNRSGVNPDVAVNTLSVSEKVVSRIVMSTPVAVKMLVNSFTSLPVSSPCE